MLVYKSHKFNQLKVKVITETVTFPPGKEAAGAVVSAVGFHLLKGWIVLNPNLPCSLVMQLR